MPAEDSEITPEVKARGLVRVIAKDLIKLFNGNKRWKAQDMNITEASTISIAIASLKLEGVGPIDRFIADIGDIVRANLKEASGLDLVNLAKSTFYMRKFEYNRDLYSHVHAECVSRRNLRELSADDFEGLQRVY